MSSSSMPPVLKSDDIINGILIIIKSLRGDVDYNVSSRAALYDQIG
jgi:hypothetical protein